MPDDDGRLAALIDNELDQESKARLLARLAQDEALRERLEELRRDRARLVTAFDALLEQAPLAKLRAAIPQADAGPPMRRDAPRSAGSGLPPKSSSAFSWPGRPPGSGSARGRSRRHGGAR